MDKNRPLCFPVEITSKGPVIIPCRTVILPTVNPISRSGKQSNPQSMSVFQERRPNYCMKHIRQHVRYNNVNLYTLLEVKSMNGRNIYLLVYVPLNVSLEWRRHHCRWKAAIFNPLLGAQGLWAGRYLYRAHLLWHGALIFLVSSEGLPHSVAS